MPQPTPDYRLYDLEQIYDTLCYIDRERFPDRVALIVQEIEAKGGDPDVVPSPILFVSGWKVTPLLQTVRWLTGLAYGAVILCSLLGLIMSLVTKDLAAGIGICTFVGILAMFCAIGVMPMRAALKKIRDKIAVEVEWISALGLAPLSAVFYCLLSLPFMERIDENAYFLSILFFLPLGFYMPFILLTYWVKYRYRDDEF